MRKDEYEKHVKSLPAILADWALLYGRRITQEEIELWTGIFSKTPPKVLAIAVEQVTQNAERMPTPGALTKAIVTAYEKHPELLPDQSLKNRVGRDSKGVPCWYWSDDPSTPAYRATDCAEGRAFLATLAQIASIKPEEAAKLMEKWANAEKVPA